MLPRPPSVGLAVDNLTPFSLFFSCLGGFYFLFPSIFPLELAFSFSHATRGAIYAPALMATPA